MTAQSHKVKASLSESLSLSSSPDLVSYQKSRVSLCGHRGNRLGTDDLKERMLQSCLSNCNLRGSSPNNTLRPFQPHLEATAMTGDAIKDAFPTLMGKSLWVHLFNGTTNFCSHPHCSSSKASFPSETGLVGVAHLRNRGTTAPSWFPGCLWSPW